LFLSVSLLSRLKVSQSWPLLSARIIKRRMSASYRNCIESDSKKDLGNIIEKLQHRFESRIDKLEKRIVTVQAHTEAILSEFFEFKSQRYDKFHENTIYEADGSSAFDMPDNRDSIEQKKQAPIDDIELNHTRFQPNSAQSDNTPNTVYLSSGTSVSADLVFPSMSLEVPSGQKNGAFKDEGNPEEPADDLNEPNTAQKKPPPLSLRIASGRELLRGGGDSDSSSSSEEDDDDEAERGSGSVAQADPPPRSARAHQQRCKRHCAEQWAIRDTKTAARAGQHSRAGRIAVRAEYSRAGRTTQPRGPNIAGRAG
jgi:hypothetical protein